MQQKLRLLLLLAGQQSRASLTLTCSQLTRKIIKKKNPSHWKQTLHIELMCAEAPDSDQKEHEKVGEKPVRVRCHVTNNSKLKGGRLIGQMWSQVYNLKD